MRNQALRSLSAADQSHLTAWQWRALIAGVLGLAISLVASLGQLSSFYRAYLPAYLFFLGLTLGSLTLLMIYYLTGGAWGFLIRRILEAGSGTLPLLAILFLPVAFGVHDLYPWAEWSPDAGDHAQRHVQPYLNVQWFWIRSAAYFGAWLAVRFAVGRASHRLELSGDGRLVGGIRTLAGLGLFAYGAGMNFAAADWVMSLQFPFHSTIFGPLMASGHLLTALSFSIVVLAWLSLRPPMASVMSPDAVNDLGSLLFAFVVVWSYMVWFQFMLIWIANLPTDILWYVPRSHGGWLWVSRVLLVFAFVIPLFLLLLRKVKRHLTPLWHVAAVIFAMQVLYAFYLVVPSYSAATIGRGWIDFITPVGIGGLWLACFLWQLRRAPVLPYYDFNQNEALRLRRNDMPDNCREAEVAHG